MLVKHFFPYLIGVKHSETSDLIFSNIDDDNYNNSKRLLAKLHDEKANNSAENGQKI
jgi:hypothetical protein